MTRHISAHYPKSFEELMKLEHAVKQRKVIANILSALSRIEGHAMYIEATRDKTCATREIRTELDKIRRWLEEMK